MQELWGIIKCLWIHSYRVKKSQNWLIADIVKSTYRCTKLCMVYNGQTSTFNFTFSESLSLSLTTRGNSLKLLQQHCHYDVRKYNFANRIIPMWSSLPNSVVTANMINTFKYSLDKFWQHQAVLYNYQFNITSTGNCSILDD